MRNYLFIVCYKGVLFLNMCVWNPFNDEKFFFVNNISLVEYFHAYLFVYLFIFLTILRFPEFVGKKCLELVILVYAIPEIKIH